MPWFLIAVISLIVVASIAGYIWWRVWRKKRALRLVVRHAQQITDTQVAAATRAVGHPIVGGSQPVADVWGHGIMAFTYVVTGTQLTQAALTKALRAQAGLAKLESPSGGDVFRLTDWWQRGGQTHFDVAYVVNDATREYVADVAKVS